MEFSEQLKIRFKNSKTILALTGAGISAESGVPTFRGKEGLWKQYRAEELATPQAFQKDPKLVWEWYIWRMELISTKSPNPAHFALAELEKNRSNFNLITQNVDDLHKKSGSQKIIEIHGNIFRNRCINCNRTYDSDPSKLKNSTECPNCKSLVRPDVLWFGESYDTELLNRAVSFAEKSEIVFVIGSSGAVGIPVELARIAKENGAFVIEINIDPSGYSRYADLFLQGKAGEILPKLIPYFV